MPGGRAACCPVRSQFLDVPTGSLTLHSRVHCSPLVPTHRSPERRRYSCGWSSTVGNGGSMAGQGSRAAPDPSSSVHGAALNSLAKSPITAGFSVPTPRFSMEKESPCQTGQKYLPCQMGTMAVGDFAGDVFRTKHAARQFAELQCSLLQTCNPQLTNYPRLSL